MTWQAPAGVPWLVWLVIMLLIGPPALGSKLAARIPGVLGVAGRWWQKRRTAEVSMGELARIRLELRALRKDWDEQVPALQRRVDALELQLSRALHQLWAARDYIRTLTAALHRHAPGIPIPAPPGDLYDED